MVHPQSPPKSLARRLMLVSFALVGAMMVPLGLRELVTDGVPVMVRCRRDEGACTVSSGSDERRILLDDIALLRTERKRSRNSGTHHRAFLELRSGGIESVCSGPSEEALSPAAADLQGFLTGTAPSLETSCETGRGNRLIGVLWTAFGVIVLWAIVWTEVRRRRSRPPS